MQAPRPLLPALAVLALVLLGLALARQDAAPAARVDGEVDGARYRLTSAAARADAVDVLPKPSPLRFEPSIAASDRRVVLDAIATARPDARLLVERVAGLVTVRVGTPGAEIAGRMRPTPDGYDVVLDLGGVYRGAGLRGVRRLVMHELAHVVDSALVTDALERELDAATPVGFGCDEGNSGGCAERAERFAESFAKWATGDIGDALYLGYSVPPPRSLSGWGAPLAALSAPCGARAMTAMRSRKSGAHMRSATRAARAARTRPRASGGE